MTKSVLTVACEIPGGYGEYIDFDSKASLLDADFVLFCPHFAAYSLEDYRGKPLLSDDRSVAIQNAVLHWRRELLDFLKAGKTVFLILSDLQEVFVSTGEKQYSGTGRNRQTTNIVKSLSNYDLVPFPLRVVESKGTSMTLSPYEHLLREYWQHFGVESQYRVHLEASEQFKPLVTTRNGGRVVGYIARAKGGGALIALPWIDFDREGTFSEDYEDEGGETDYKWTSEAIEWGKRYFETLVSLDSGLRRQNDKTHTPQWADDESYTTKQETALSEQLLQVQGEISDLEKTREEVEIQRSNAGSLKALLFEQGHPLENAVLEAMRLIGFEADRYRGSDSEFDVVMECLEGRCIGEVEGRDNRAIDINKMRQLETNIHEDLSREGVSEPAKAVLFGNAYRLTPPSERPAEQFTAKCIAAAKRTGTALIRTCDLFEVAKELVDNPDQTFAASCRQAIFHASGQGVQFPTLTEPETAAQVKRTKSKKTVAKSKSAMR